MGNIKATTQLDAKAQRRLGGLKPGLGGERLKGGEDTAIQDARVFPLKQSLTWKQDKSL